MLKNCICKIPHRCNPPPRSAGEWKSPPPPRFSKRGGNNYPPTPWDSGGNSHRSLAKSGGGMSEISNQSVKFSVPRFFRELPPKTSKTPYSPSRGGGKAGGRWGGNAIFPPPRFWKRGGIPLYPPAPDSPPAFFAISSPATGGGYIYEYHMRSPAKKVA